MDNFPLCKWEQISISKDVSLHLIKLTKSSYLSSFLRAIWELLEAIWPWKVKVSVPSPRVQKKPMRERFHVQHSLSSCYISFFLVLFMLGKNFFTGIFLCGSELTFVTLTSKYAFWAFLHTPFALISGRALSSLSPLNCSLSTCCSCGSTSTSLALYLINLLQNRRYCYVSLSQSLPSYNCENGLCWIFGHKGSLRVSYVMVCCNAGPVHHGTLLWLKWNHGLQAVVHLANLMRLFVLLVGQFYLVQVLMCFQPHVIDCLSNRSCFLYFCPEF